MWFESSSDFFIAGRNFVVLVYQRRNEKIMGLDAGARGNDNDAGYKEWYSKNVFLHTKNFRIDQTRRIVARDIFVQPRDLLRFDKWREQSICNGPIREKYRVYIFDPSY